MSNQEPSELWRPVMGYEDNYEVSSHGRVRSITKYGRVLTPSPRNGYHKVSLCKDGKPKTYTIHRLVAEAFIENPEDKKTVNHIDGNRINNMLSNLEWATYQENIGHALLNGLKKSGSKAVSAKLTDEQVLEIRQKAREGAIQAQLARDYGVTPMSIFKIVHNISYKNAVRNRIQQLTGDGDEE